MTGWAWCPACGHRAVIRERSLDPRHPLVECQRLIRPGVLAHPQLRPGILEQGELQDTLASLGRKAARERHYKSHTRRLVASCRYCAELRAGVPGAT